MSPPAAAGRLIRLAAALAAAACCLASDAAPPGDRALHYYYPVATPRWSGDVDVCVYGATPAGVMAAVQAARMGRSAVLIEFGRHVGGMTASGLSATDGGKWIGGLASEFYRGVGSSSGFLPGKAEVEFRKLLSEARVTLLLETRLASVTLEGAKIRAVVAENGTVVHARMFIDATYEGDLMARAKVSFTVGREANAQFGETIDGVRAPGAHNFALPVDPYVIPGDVSSGLLPGITNPAGDAPGREGSADRRIQAYNFRMYLAKMPDAIPFPRPAAYDANRYELCLRYLRAGAHADQVMQPRTGDSNNQGGFSTDDIGMNLGWPEGDYATRESIFREHVAYQQGLMYFLANDDRVPDRVRSVVAGYGLDKRCFPDTGGWPHQLYVREARRMVSDYVMTEHDCRHAVAAPDPIALGEYNMDSHNCQRFVALVDGRRVARNEGDVQAHIPGPYGISYRAIVPKAGECPNLIVTVCLSATHIAYGSIRMEPVFMVLGQSAGTAAVLALDRGVAVQSVDYPSLRAELDRNGEVVEPTARK